MEFLALYVFLMVCVLVVDFFDNKDTQEVIVAHPVIVSGLTVVQLNNALIIKKAMDAKVKAKIAEVNAKNKELLG